MNTTENNKIIAEFMKWDILNDMTYSKATKGKWVELDKLKFHSNWNWLMEVVEKIESIGFTFETKKNWARITRKGENIILRWEEDKTKIEAVYNACIEFIKWYNEQKSAKNN